MIEIIRLFVLNSNNPSSPTYGDFKVFPDGLMDELTSKTISSCTVSYTALPMKTDLHFQSTLA